MKINDLIKKRATVRKYKNSPISRKLINKIIEAGIWGPSIHHWQPWRFVIIQQNKLIKLIAVKVNKKLKSMALPGFIYIPTIRALANAKLLICVYNTKSFSNFVKKISKRGERYSRIPNVKIAEISAISAAIQNIILTAESLGVGSCWLDSPLFCKNDINKLLNIRNDELIAILTLGYPDEKGKRTLRKSKSDILKFM